MDATKSDRVQRPHRELKTICLLSADGVRPNVCSTHCRKKCRISPRFKST